MRNGALQKGLTAGSPKKFKGHMSKSISTEADAVVAPQSGSRITQTEQGAERVLQILSASAQLFALKGYDGTSMRDIAEACNISKSLLYHHFKSKDEIFNRITLGSTHQLYAFVAQEIPPGASAAAKIRAFMLASANYFDRYRWVWMASTSSFWSDSDRSRHKERMMWRDRYERLLRELIEEGIELGEFRQVDVAIAGRLILSSLNWMHRWYDPEKSLRASEIADRYFDIMFAGLKATKG